MSSKRHAERLAKHIEAYWRRQGFDLKAYAILESEANPGRDGSPYEWTIRTVPPLKNGIPPGAKTTAAKGILRAFDTPDWRGFDDED